MNPKVLKVQVLDNYRLWVQFENSEVRIVDISPFLEKGIFRELKNQGYFSQVRVVAGAVQWPNEQDLSHDTLYLLGKVPVDSAEYAVAN